MDNLDLGDAILAKVKAAQTASGPKTHGAAPSGKKDKGKAKKQDKAAKPATVVAPKQVQEKPKKQDVAPQVNGSPKGKQKKSKASKPAPTPQAPSAPTPQANGSAEGPNRREVLLKEILALGGTEEDLELIGGSESSDEGEGDEEGTVTPAAKGSKKGGDAPPDAALMKELKSFMTGLDFTSFAPAAGPSSSKPAPAPIAAAPALSKEERQAAASSALASWTERLDASDPAAEAKKAKKEARKEQRRLEAEKRQQAAEEAAREKAEADDVEARRQRRKEVKEQVEGVKGRMGAGGATSSRDGWIVPPRPQWYDTTGFPALSVPTSTEPLSEEQLSALHARGETLLSSLASKFSDSLHSTSSKATDSILSTSDKAFVTKILTSGTSSDKLSALLLLASSAPMHGRSFLTTLMGLCRKQSREEAGRAVRGVIDWLRGNESAGDGGLPNRKLKVFRDQPMLPALLALRRSNGLGKGKGKMRDAEAEGKQVGDEWLVLWAFEDWLKKWYMDLLRVIENFSVDPLPYIRSQSVSYSFHLLRDKPEQEQNLLRLLINKLGDSDRSVASRASYHTLQILQSHPLMKGIVVTEVAGLVLKTAAPAKVEPTKGKTGKGKNAAPATQVTGAARHHDHARYYGTITLNQIVLAKADAIVANKLVEVYFELFKDILGRAADEDAKPGPVDEPIETDQAAAFAKSKAKAKSSKKKKAEMEQADEAAEKSSRLTAAILTGLNRAFPYASLDDSIFRSHMDTLFRIVHTGAFNVSVQALVLIQHIVSSDERSKAAAKVSKEQAGEEDGLVGRFYRALYGTLFDPRLVASSKQAMYLNLLFKSVKADPSPRRVCAFVKRIVQILPLHQPPFICGALYLLGELFAGIPGLRELSLTEAKPDESGEYDGRKRDPLYANAESSRLWELLPLLNHFHPSVALNAQQLQSGQPVTASADLEQHTLSRFLDRFVYRNAKKAPGGLKGPSAMQPGAQGADRSGLVLMRKGVQDSAEPLNSTDFANRRTGAVPVDHLFFHKYFTNKAEIDQARAKARRPKGPKDSDDDNFSTDEDAFDDAASAGSSKLDEKEVWRAMQASMPRFADDPAGAPDIDDDSDSDAGMSRGDFDSDDDDDDDEAAEEAAENERGEESGADSNSSEAQIPQDGRTELGSVEGDGSEGSDIDWLGALSDADSISDGEDVLDGTSSQPTGIKRARDVDRGADRDAKRSRRSGGAIFADADQYARMIDDDHDEAEDMHL